VNVCWAQITIFTFQLFGQQQRTFQQNNKALREFLDGVLISLGNFTENLIGKINILNFVKEFSLKHTLNLFFLAANPLLSQPTFVVARVT
jgi:hypothetical protein